MPEKKIVDPHRTTSLWLDFKDRKLTVASGYMNGFRCGPLNRSRDGG